MQRVNHPVFVHMKVKRVVGVKRVVRVAVLRFVPADDFAHIFNDRVAFGNVLQGKYALAMHA